MKLGQAVAFLFAFAKLVDAEGGVRGRELDSAMKHLGNVNRWDEHTEKCDGAICGLWGDPHLFSCDGLGFDCNAVGVFTLMKNFLYNIQTHHINVGAIEMGLVLGWNNWGKATYTSDVAIQNVERKDDEHPEPILQFGFPEFIPEHPEARSEHNCFTEKMYDQYLSIGKAWPVATSIAACREECMKDTHGCTQFTWFQGTHICMFADNSAAIKQNTFSDSSVSGQADRCGVDYSNRGGDFPSEAKLYWNDYKYRNDSTKNKKNCPVLFYKDSELQDISGFGDTDRFYETDTTYAEFYARNRIRVVTTTKEGSSSEIVLETAGLGPGERFGCHWNIFICLPSTEKDEFTGDAPGYNVSTGLMGSPDGNTQNDWITPEGEVLDIPSSRKNQAAFEYCTGNWCVSETENIITPPNGATFDHIKCIGEEYTPITTDNCVVSVDVIKEHCTNHTGPLQNMCETECCLSGECDDMDGVVTNHTVTLDDSEEAWVYDNTTLTRDDEEPQCESSHVYNGLAESVCPDGKNILEILHNSGTDVEPVIYDIKQNAPRDAAHGLTVSLRVGAGKDTVNSAFVRYEKKVGVFANDPACDRIPVADQCWENANNQITVGCIEYPHTPPFALFDVYFAVSDGDGDGVELEKCCGELDSPRQGVVKYSYKIECGCPEDA